MHRELLSYARHHDAQQFGGCDGVTLIKMNNAYLVKV
jgi:hypothetical protein